MTDAEARHLAAWDGDPKNDCGCRPGRDYVREAGGDRWQCRRCGRVFERYPGFKAEGS